MRISEILFYSLIVSFLFSAGYIAKLYTHEHEQPVYRHKEI